ncbi:MAG: hypothetical protein ACK4MX_00890 [Thermaurantiacus sp.]
MPAAAAAMLLAGAGPVRAEVTECDRLAAHPSDPDRVAPGVAQRDVDLPAAIAACQAAVEADPGNPRLNYQLGRVLAYAGRGQESRPFRDAAIAGDYPQALFVVGFITLFGLNEQPQDSCRAADLVRRSALAGRQAGEIAFVHWALEGRFDGCPTPQDRDEMARFLQSARDTSGGEFFQGLLIDRLEADLLRRD